MRPLEARCSDTTLHTLSSPCDTSSPALSTCLQALSQLLSCHIPHLLICLFECDSTDGSTPRGWYHHSNPILSRKLDIITRIRYYLANSILSLESDIIHQIRYYLSNPILYTKSDIILYQGRLRSS
jgi:hypothetical protein